MDTPTGIGKKSYDHSKLSNVLQQIVRFYAHADPWEEENNIKIVEERIDFATEQEESDR